MVTTDPTIDAITRTPLAADMPQSVNVCKVIADFIRSWNEPQYFTYGRGKRVAMMRQVLPLVSNTSGSDALRLQRAYIIIDWTTRELVPRWLSFCDRRHYATLSAKLQGLPEIRDVAGTQAAFAAVGDDLIAKRAPYQQSESVYGPHYRYAEPIFEAAYGFLHQAGWRYWPLPELDEAAATDWRVLSLALKTAVGIAAVYMAGDETRWQIQEKGRQLGRSFLGRKTWRSRMNREFAEYAAKPVTNRLFSPVGHALRCTAIEMIKRMCAVREVV